MRCQWVTRARHLVIGGQQVHLVEGLHRAPFGVTLPGLVLGAQDDEGDGVGPGGVDPRDQVGDARPDGAHADARLAADAGVGIGHVRGGLLVAGHDELHARRRPQAADGVQDGAELAAGDAEDVADVFLNEATDEKFGADHGSSS